MAADESARSNSRRELELQQIREALGGLRFGSVNIIVQDGVVVQIDRTEKKRIRAHEASESQGEQASIH